MDTQLSLSALLIGAASLGVLHTLIEPDHYLPFATLARLRGWSILHTMRTTFLCGLGHLLSSILIAFAGVAIGASVGEVEAVNDSLVGISKWVFFIFSLAYFIYGLKFAFAKKSLEESDIDSSEQSCCTVENVHHSDEHSDSFFCRACGHTHRAAHLHSADGINFWVLFFVFVFGPCEVLVPMVMYPASRFDWFGVAAVSGTFAFSTIAAMLAMVVSIYYGFKIINFDKIQRWGYLLTGVILLLCSIFMFIGFHQ